MSNDNGPRWRFLTNHTQVLLCIARDPDVRTRDIAHMVGITERAAQRIVAELADAGFVTIERVGRRNRYTINGTAAMRHTAQRGHEIVDVVRQKIMEVSTQQPQRGNGHGYLR